MQAPAAEIRDEPPTTWVENAPGLRWRRMVEANGAAMVMYWMRPGIRFQAHSHPVAELGVVLQGGGTTRIGSESRSLRAGDSFYIPPGVPHSFVVDEGTAVLMLNVTVPLSGGEAGASYAGIETLISEALDSRESEAPNL